MKKFVAVILALLTLLSGTVVMGTGAAAAENAASAVGSIGFDTDKALYVHGVLSSDDTQAWQAWQSKHDEDFNEIEPGVKYFFLPTSADTSKIDVYNAFSYTVTLNGVSIPSGECKTVNYELNKAYSVRAENKIYTLKIMKSNAEAGIYINNSNADGNGTDLMEYLNEDKERNATATGAIVDSNGNIDNTPIKKIKGRGNTSWWKPKKGYNITYTENVVIGGMPKGKKFSILANYQDDSLSRNRFLYDLSDAAGMPYASDSRYVDFYVNGFYWGSYQMCQKVEVGKNCVVNDIDDTAYLNADGSINADFPFLCEVDASASYDDYYVDCAGNNKITIKAPEIDPGQPGYEEVKEYVRTKFNELYNAARNSSSDLSAYADVDSVAKLFLINEIGKNWDAGVSSLFFVYKQDENGVYKFYGSPVWDYDNSLGNATGVWGDLDDMGVDDYEEFTGWWCRYKGKSSRQKTSTNIMNNIARNTSVLNEVPRVWFESFVPALNDFYGTTDKGIMMSNSEYYNLLKDSAAMNYQSGWLLYTGDWICDHSRLDTAVFDKQTNTFKVTGSKTYDFNFDGMYDYTVDWLGGRMAWLSAQFYPDYTPSKLMGDVDLSGVIDVNDATMIQKWLVKLAELSDEQIELADTDRSGDIDVRDATLIQKYCVGIVSSL